MENRHCERCGAQWQVELEHWRGEGLFSTHRWTTERIVGGTPCQCEKRAEEEEEEEKEKKRRKELTELYRYVTNNGLPLPRTTPVRLRYFDGGFDPPRPLKERCRNYIQFWMVWGQLYRVSQKDRTAVKVDATKVEYVNGELLIRDSELLF